MTDSESLILDLVGRWEEAATAGQLIALDDLCRDHPDLLSAVRRHVAALQSMTPLLATPESRDTATDGAGGAPASVTRAVGETRYAAGAVHARGGLGEVLLAEDAALERTVALKRMRDHCRHDRAARRRFVREAEITGQLQHPGIVPVYGFARDEHGDPVYAMRFVEGQTLHDAIGALHAAGADPAGLPFRQLLARFVAVCQAVAYGHSRGVVHRDLKPANVLIGAYGETIVLDWGLAKRVGTPDDTTGHGSARPDDPTLTRAGDVLGTPAFMSPEQATGDPDVGPASDVFALGAALFAILTGRGPYSGPADAVLDRARRAHVPPPRTVRPAVPRALDAVCRTAMTRNPADRYPTALALAEDVERWLAGEVPTVYPETLAERGRRWARRHRSLVNALAATFLVGAVAAGVGTTLLYREQQATAAQRDRADQNFALADETASELLAAVIDHPRLKQADFHQPRRDLLRRAVPLYEQLAAQRPADQRTQFHQAVNLYRLGQIQHELGEEARALDRLTEARDRLDGSPRAPGPDRLRPTTRGLREGHRPAILPARLAGRGRGDPRPCPRPAGRPAGRPGRGPQVVLDAQ